MAKTRRTRVTPEEVTETEDTSVGVVEEERELVTRPDTTNEEQPLPKTEEVTEVSSAIKGPFVAEGTRIVDADGKVIAVFGASYQATEYRASLAKFFADAANK